MISLNNHPKFLRASLPLCFYKADAVMPVFSKSHARAVNLAVAEGSRTLFPLKKVRERKEERKGQKTVREDRMEEKTAGKGELSHKFSRGNQVISRGTPMTHSLTILFCSLLFGKNDSDYDKGRV